MILAHPTFTTMIPIDDEKITVLAVENPSQLSSYVYELNAQVNGAPGQFALFEDNESMPLSSIKLILDPFNLDVNAKDIQNGLIMKIKMTMNSEQYYLPMQELISNVAKFSFDVLSEIDSELICSETDTNSLIKFISPFFEKTSNTLLEEICQYLRISSKFTKTRVFVFVNLKTFLNQKQLDLLFKHISYNKLKVLLLESTTYPHSSNINEIIIDSDLCEING